MDVQKFAGIPTALATRGVRGYDVTFNDKWASNLAQEFEGPLRPLCITYKAVLTFDGLEGIYLGFVDVRRDGTFSVRLDH
jgi:hypothetical protein